MYSDSGKTCSEELSFLMPLSDCVVSDFPAVSGHCAGMLLTLSDSNSISLFPTMLSHPFSSKPLSLLGSFCSLWGNQPLFPWLFGEMGSEPGSSPGCCMCQAVFSLSPVSQLKSKENDYVIDFDIEMV